MNNINFSDIAIWIQADSTEGNDIVIKDGENLPLDSRDYETISEFVVGIEPHYKEIGISANLKLYKTPDGYLIMSNLQETDVVSRRRAFAAVIKRHSIEECWDILSRTLNQIGLHCPTEDYQKIIGMTKVRNKKKGYAIIIALGIVIVSLLTVFAKLAKL